MAATTYRLGFRNSTVGWLAATGLLWFAGYAAYLSSWNVPLVGRIRPLADMGWGNWVIGAIFLLSAVAVALWPRKPGTVGNRWAGPAMASCGIAGLVWIVLFYTLANTSTHVPYLSDAIVYLGNWNLAVGMGLIMAAFGFAMKWE